MHDIAIGAWRRLHAVPTGTINVRVNVMADKKVKYTDSVFTAELEKKDELHPEASNPVEGRRLQTTKGDAEDVAEAVAEWMEERPDRLRVGAEHTADSLREAARRSRASQLNAAAAKRMYELFRREERLRRAELQGELNAVYGQAKAQLKGDAGLSGELARLFSYFKPNK
jgi:uncharacterized membrane protein YccC